MLLSVCPVVNHVEQKKGGGEEFEVLVTDIMKCIISSSSYSGLLVLSHPAGGLTIVSYPDRIFRARWKNRSAYSIFIQVRQNAGEVFVCSNLMLDVLEYCIPRCVPTIY